MSIGERNLPNFKNAEEKYDLGLLPNSNRLARVGLLSLTSSIFCKNLILGVFAGIGCRPTFLTTSTNLSIASMFKSDKLAFGSIAASQLMPLLAIIRCIISSWLIR